MSTSKRSKKYAEVPSAEHPKASPIEQDLTAFLSVLCIEWGFCIPPEEADRIARSDKITADEFALEVLKAEGLNCYSPWFKKISGRFSERFADSLDASTYR